MSFKHLRINPRRPGASTGLGLERASLPGGYENAEFAGYYESAYEIQVKTPTEIVRYDRWAKGYRGAVNPRTGKPSPIRLRATGSPGAKRTRRALKRAAQRRLTRTIAR